MASMCCDTAQALVFLLVSMCCDTAQVLVFLLVSVCCDTAQTLVFLLVSVCCDTAQALVFFLVSVCCDTAQALVFLLVSMCCDTAKAKPQYRPVDQNISFILADLYFSHLNLTVAVNCPITYPLQKVSVPRYKSTTISPYIAYNVHFTDIRLYKIYFILQVVM